MFEAVETVANAGGVPLISSHRNLAIRRSAGSFARDFENAGGAVVSSP